VLRHADGVKGQTASGSNREGESTDAERRGVIAASSMLTDGGSHDQRL